MPAMQYIVDRWRGRQNAALKPGNSTTCGLFGLLPCCPRGMAFATPERQDAINRIENQIRYNPLNQVFRCFRHPAPFPGQSGSGSGGTTPPSIPENVGSVIRTGRLTPQEWLTPRHGIWTISCRKPVRFSLAHAQQTLKARQGFGFDCAGYLTEIKHAFSPNPANKGGQMS